MISISSWWAERQICVVRAMAASGARPSGTKKSAVDLWNCILLVLFFGGEGREAGGCDGLTMTLFLLVRDVVANALGNLRELGAQYVARGGEDQIATFAGEHAAEHE